MNTFTYSALKNAWINDDRIGRWSGSPVYAVERAAMGDECVNGVYYVIFDDGNKLVKLNSSGEFILYGYITESGHVEEYNYKMRYISPKEEREAAAATEAEREASVAPATEEYEEVVGDIKLSDLVAQTLETARTMTIDSLLEGFNYGLD